MNQKVIIFGCGKYFELKQETVQKEYEIVGFIDNSVKTNQGELKQGLPVVNPMQLSLFPDSALVLLMSSAWPDMWNQLKKIGIEDNRIIFGCNFNPGFNSEEEILKKNSIIVSAKDNKICFKCHGDEKLFKDRDEIKQFYRVLYNKEYPYINEIKNMPLEPASRHWGCERGTPIDRYYIEKFLSDNSSYICGDVMEISEDKYTKRYGGDNVVNSYILHVNGYGENVIKGNLVTGEGIHENSIDCLICTQTLPFIFDIKKCVKNIFKMLKPGGSALITTGGITPISYYDYVRWGHYWSFTDQSLKQLLSEYFDEDNIAINVYGNMKVAISFLYGLCLEDLNEEDLNYYDELYPVTIAARVIK